MALHPSREQRTRQLTDLKCARPCKCALAPRAAPNPGTGVERQRGAREGVLVARAQVRG